jgi:hypothetical protein
MAKTITWQFSTGDDAESALIRWKNDSEISHVDVITQNGDLLGARFKGGVLVRKPDYAKFLLRILVTIPVTDEQYSLFWDFVTSKIGQKYDTQSIIGIALGNNQSQPGTEDCSELQSDGVKAGVIFQIAKASYKIDPETFRLLVTAVPLATEVRYQP